MQLNEEEVNTRSDRSTNHRPCHRNPPPTTSSSAGRTDTSVVVPLFTQCSVVNIRLKTEAWRDYQQGEVYSCHVSCHILNHVHWHCLQICMFMCVSSHTRRVIVSYPRLEWSLKEICVLEWLQVSWFWLWLTSDRLVYWARTQIRVLLFAAFRCRWKGFS